MTVEPDKFKNVVCVAVDAVAIDEAAASEPRVLYQAGIDSGASVPMSDEDWEELRAAARVPATGKAQR